MSVNVNILDNNAVTINQQSPTAVSLVNALAYAVTIAQKNHVSVALTNAIPNSVSINSPLVNVRYLTPKTILCSSNQSTIMSGVEWDNAFLVLASHDNVQTGTHSLILPDPVLNQYRLIRVISNGTTNSNHKIEIVPATGNSLDGGTDGFTINRGYEGVTVWSNGIEWFMIQSKNV